MGYRGYTTRHLPVRFPFGFGLSYTSFDIGKPRLSATTFEAGDILELEVGVTDTGERGGSEVVQCYVAPEACRLFRPRMELRSFGKVRLEPGESTTLTLRLDDRAFAYWDPADRGHSERWSGVPVAAGRGSGPREEPGWHVDPGTYDLHMGRSSADIRHVVPVDLG